MPAELVTRVEAAPDAPEEPAPRESMGGLFERWVAGRLLIWLGGVALVRRRRSS